jgi:adenine phosphoribosyltransferase
MHLDAIPKGSKVLLIDDVLATGGTIGAAIELIHRVGGEVAHVLALLEIEGLPGRATLQSKYPNIPITSLVVS